MDVTLLYTESGLTYSRVFSLLALKGMDEPDKLQKVGVVHDCLDGSVSEQVLGFRKEVILTFKPQISGMDSRFLVKWFDAETKTIFYGAYVSAGVTDKELTSEWLYDMEYGRKFDVTLYDEHVYHAWDDGISTGDDVIYFLNNVEISENATPDSPEVLTTNSGKLALMENGQPWPSFNSTLYDHLIWILAGGPMGDICNAGYGHSAQVISGNMQISVAVQSGYQVSVSGKLRANISIYPRLKTL